MKKYHAIFYGRKRGAIGRFDQQVDQVEANLPEDVRLKLYDNWDHISGLIVKEIKDV